MEKLYPKNNFHSYLFQYLGNDGSYDYYVLPLNQLVIDNFQHSKPLIFILRYNNPYNNIMSNYSMILEDKYPEIIPYYKIAKKLLKENNYHLNKE